MAEEKTQRPYRASEPPPARTSNEGSRGDPLAELARLIGQTDPFGEFGRERRAAARPPQESDWTTQPLGTPYATHAAGQPRKPAAPYADNGYPPAGADHPALQEFAGQKYARQPYASASPSGFDEYQGEGDERNDPYDDQQEYDDNSQFEDEYYEDAPSPGRRFKLIAIVGIVGLAVVGTAGAFGYRALFGPSEPAKPPPVIKADTSPTKIVPQASTKDSPSNKLITDRVNERGQSEKLVSREEQPINRSAVGLTQAVPQSAIGSGVVASEPKKIRTIAIHPDQPVMTDAAPPSGAVAAAPAARSAPPQQARAAPAPSPAARPSETASAEAEQGTPTVPSHPAAGGRQPASTGGAPLSLNPNAPPTRAPAAAAPSTERTAALAPQASAQAGAVAGGAYVQVSSQRSENEAEAAFRGLQTKFPDQLGGRPHVIHRVDLGAKGTYYRALVGPFANASEAGQLCSSLKAAGGQCLIQRN
ncbi:MAG TPA: SPOR domain-containing protein [Pseudolabrys sp.]|nr:SPOR domain-containing protein [Pseudolabrys sp.]